MEKEKEMKSNKEKCKHNYQQLLNNKGKPVISEYTDNSKEYQLFCTKCGKVKGVGRYE